VRRFVVEIEDHGECRRVHLELRRLPHFGEGIAVLVGPKWKRCEDCADLPAQAANRGSAASTGCGTRPHPARSAIMGMKGRTSRSYGALY
jgi:hypothetical protein